MDSYYGTATAARDAANLYLFGEGSSKAPARVFDATLGYHFRVKGPDGRIMRFFFSVDGVQRSRGRR